MCHSEFIYGYHKSTLLKIPGSGTYQRPVHQYISYLFGQCKNATLSLSKKNIQSFITLYQQRYNTSFGAEHLKQTLVHNLGISQN